MKSFSFAKALTVGCLLSLSLPIACGDDDDSTPNNTAGTSSTGGDGAGGEPGSNGGMSAAAGAGGAGASLPPGISSTPKMVACGAEMCGSAAVPPALYIDPCCDAGTCGLDTGFLALVGAAFTDKCQPKGQVGEVNDACPSTPASTIPFESGGNTIMVPIEGFVGCCRENGMCGVVVDDVMSPVLGKVTSLGLGCVDAAPFFPGKTPVSCGAGGAGGGGAGGASGGDTSTLGGTGGAGGNQ